jgi:Fungal specific transcription factor domain
MSNPDQTAYWTNSLANNPTGTFLSFAATDPALFHATLSVVCQHEGFMRRQPASRLFYFHRGEAIRIIAARIGNEVEAISDATIAAVAVLSIADVSRNLPYHLSRS